MIVLCTAVYIGCLFYLPQKMRLLLVIGAAVIIIFMFKPRPGFWLPVLPFIFFAAGNMISLGEFNPSISTLVMVAFVFLYVIDRVMYNEIIIIPSSHLLAFFLAFLIQVASIFISIHVHGQHMFNAIRDGSSLFMFAPLAIIIPVLCSSEDKFNRLLRAVVLALLAASVIGVMQYFSITSFSRVDMGIGYVYRGRVASLLGNANVFAGYLEMSIPLALAQIFREKSSLWKLTSAAAVALGLLSVLYTFSRGGLIFTFLGCGITLLYIFRSKIWVPFLVSTAALILLFVNSETFDRQMSFFMNPMANLHQPTILHRIISYRGFLNQFAESPATGVGWGADEFYWGRSMIYSFWEVRHCVSTQKISEFGGLNSLFLNHAVKGGVVSLLAVFLMFATVFAVFFKALRKGSGKLAVAIAAGLFSFMLHQIVGNQIRYPAVNSQLWLLTGILIVLATYDYERADGNDGKLIPGSNAELNGQEN